MKRQVTTQQISWLLDIERNGQLNLNPPYQRKSVWSLKDRRFFLDTIFRNYPAPPVFIYRAIDDTGRATYNVVDGKQRLETILLFSNGKIRLSDDMGDDRLNGKNINELDVSIRRCFWDYSLIVDFIDVGQDESMINNVFDRMNRNSKNLQPQELRHARYDGWFISFVEAEVMRDSLWKDINVTTKARETRMSDVQFISELLMITISKTITGFSQDKIDEFYSKYDNIEDLEDACGDEAEVIFEFNRVKNILRQLQINCQLGQLAKPKTNSNIYTLWAYLTLNEVSDIDAFSNIYKQMLEEFPRVAEYNDEEIFNLDHSIVEYYQGSDGAATDLPKRQKRLDALKSYIDQCLDESC